MFRLRFALGVAIICCAGLLSLSAGDVSTCTSSCNEQYNSTLKYCKANLARKGRRDWYQDCVKNAEKFRAECLRRCR